MDTQTEQTMAENLLKNTGKSLAQWVEIAKSHLQPKHGQTVQLMKERYNLGLFFADLIVHKANGTDAASFSADELITMQYKGKEHLLPIYTHLMEHMQQLGKDIEVAPKKAYVSLRRTKQFACLKPATKTRFEIDLILKNTPAQGVLESIEGTGAMCTHRIKVTDVSNITPEILAWIKLAYENA